MSTIFCAGVRTRKSYIRPTDIITSGPVGVVESLVFVNLVIQINPQNVFHKCKAKQDSTVLTTMRNKFLDAEDMSPLTEPCFSAHALRIRLAEIRKPPNIFGTGKAKEAGSKPEATCHKRNA